MSNWYAMADIPDGRCYVRVWWFAHGVPSVHEVVRSWSPRSKSWMWLTMAEGETRVLPPRGRDADAWAKEPDCWQPAMDAWTWPNGIEPKPLMPHQVPRADGTRQRFQAVSDAEAAEMAREMEADRETARAQGDGHKTTFETRWWRDITSIRYEPAGEVSRKQAEGRVLRALSWCGAMDDVVLRKSWGAAMARMAMTAAEAAKLAEIELKDRIEGTADIIPRFDPLPQDHQDFVVAMGWYSAINPPETWSSKREAWTLNRVQRVMLMRTLTIPLSWADIAHELRVSSRRVRQLYDTGIDACWRASNGERVRRDVEVRDQMEALRERNRDYRRGAAK